ncbi:ADP-ribosylation factor GTPase-activating protein effector protein 2 [[Candida] railenensis]|uniref:ADP-ribosylation factor GTPase-activating protein effector protein 2 n=1 Tax=[Candida] railenensis TaxID=45579 RepID=A0A9P0QNG3_9ASCO|nr:ADP-ribosylation factor GTPase-activating protein effector protein 2 [[Candida] railenensis]
MNRNALPSSKKTHSEKHKAILKSLLKEGSNKTCADCKTAVHPRWASWSLGCFVCIRCSGIHRSMGTHISKVKSVDLDAWTDEQVENMLRWGNDKCNLYWEAKLPDGYIPDGSKIENFIRTKYDMKKWVASSQIPNPSTLSVGQTQTRASAPAPGASAAPTPRSSQGPAVTNSKSSTSVPIKQKPSTNLLDDDFGSFTSSVSSSPKPASTPTIGKLPSNDSFKQPGSGGAQSAQSTGGSLNNNNNNNTSNGRPDLKKSILSLYSSPSSSSSSIIQPQQQRQHQQQQPSYLSQSSVNSISNSLNGLNFTSNAKPSPVIQHQQQHQQQQTQKPVVQNSWNNEWSETRDSSSAGNWTSAPTTQPMTNSTYGGSNTTLDDDLFKNVWG